MLKDGKFLEDRKFPTDKYPVRNSSTGGGDLLAANNLSDVANANTSAINLGLVTDLSGNSDAEFPTVKAVNTALTTLVESGTYTPTAANGVNLTGTPTISKCNFLRVDTVVTVSGVATLVDPTVITTGTSFTIDLPIATTGLVQSDIAGVGSNYLLESIPITCNGAGLALFSWTSTNITSFNVSFTFTYEIN